MRKSKLMMSTAIISSTRLNARFAGRGKRWRPSRRLGRGETVITTISAERRAGGKVESTPRMKEERGRMKRPGWPPGVEFRMSDLFLLTSNFLLLLIRAGGVAFLSRPTEERDDLGGRRRLDGHC